MFEQAEQALLDYIQTEQLKPGDVLPSEAWLAQAFGVSRPVVREAIRALVGRSVVEVVNGKGAVIRPLDSRSLDSYFERAVQMEHHAIIQLMEVRRGLEVQSAFYAAQRRTPEQIQVLQDTLKFMRQHIEDPEAYADLDAEFHVQIAAATQNEMFYNLISSIRGAIRDSIRAGLSTRTDHTERERSHTFHEQLFEQIAGQDAPAAAETMALHHDDALAALLRHYKLEP